MSGKKKRKVFIIILLLIITLPLIMAGISFIGKVAPDSIIPDSFELYISVPNPIRLLNLVLGHEHLADVLELAELTPYTPILNQLKNSGLAENNFLRFAARGKLDAVLLTDERFIAAWDTGILSPLLRLLPALAGRLGIPGLYHVRAGQNSHFEYRAEDGTVLFIGPYRNLLVFTNNPALYQSVIAGTSRDGGIIGASAKSFSSRKYDIAFLLSPGALGNIFAGADPQISSAINLLQFPGPVELSLQFLPNQLRLRLISPLETRNQALQRIIERNSPAQPLLAMIPDTTQYLTLLSAGSLRELLDAASAISVRGSGTNWEGAIRRADSSARATLGMSLEDLLFSWSGTQFAVYGLEGRAHPVIAVEIRDENKRREVFDRAFSSIFVRENIQLVLDGNRIPRIEIPGFLNSLLSMMGADIPSPFYVVQNNYLFISESAETLISAVNAVRRNQVLPRQELWRTLSEDNSGPASFSVFYSMDRSLPFFLRGSNTAAAVLRLYRQGLLRLYLENSVLNISLSVIPGAGRGLVPLAGFPLDLSARGRTGNQLYLISSGRDTRLLLTQGNNVLAVNPIDRNIRELNVPGSPGLGIYAIPAEDGAWVVNSQGQVSLVNIDLENLRGFPINTGIRLSAPPAAWGERLFLSAEDGSVYTVDDRASVNRWGGTFFAPLRSPPSFLNFRNTTFAGVYPKSFFGEIFILDNNGLPLRGWPAIVPGIAFGSPLLFSAQFPDRAERLFAAFITQAGELTVYTETAEALAGFPLELEGVFYVQPVFDGENLWIIESRGLLYRIGLNGEVLSQQIPRVLAREEAYITAANTSGRRSDPGTGIFFSGEGNALFGYSRHFASLDGFPLPVWGRPVFGDINGDGTIEVAGIGMDNRLYIWQFR